MNDRLRFHLDEHMDPDIAIALRRRGIDVTTTVEARIRTSSDDVQLGFACRESRVLVTDDTDFLRYARTSSDHPGIVFCDRMKLTMGDIIRFLVLAYEVYGPDDMSGRVEFV